MGGKRLRSKIAKMERILQSNPPKPNGRHPDYKSNGYAAGGFVGVVHPDVQAELRREMKLHRLAAGFRMGARRLVTLTQAHQTIKGDIVKIDGTNVRVVDVAANSFTYTTVDDDRDRRERKARDREALVGRDYRYGPTNFRRR